MTSLYKNSAGTDLDSLFEPMSTSGTEASDVGVSCGYKRSDGSDIGGHLTTGYVKIDRGSATAATGYKNVAGADLNTLYAGLGTVSYYTPGDWGLGLDFLTYALEYLGNKYVAYATSPPYLIIEDTDLGFPLLYIEKEIWGRKDVGLYEGGDTNIFYAVVDEDSTVEASCGYRDSGGYDGTTNISGFTLTEDFGRPAPSTENHIEAFNTMATYGEYVRLECNAHFPVAGMTANPI